MRTKELVPDYAAEDFDRYYRGTFIRYNGNPFYVEMVDGGVVLGIEHTSEGNRSVRAGLADLRNWNCLRPEDVGWTAYESEPLYLKRVPVRQASKGLAPNNVRVSHVWWWNDILSALFPEQHRSRSRAGEHDANTSQIVACLLQKRQTNARDVDKELADIMEGKKLFSIITREAMLCINPLSKEYPIVGFAGEMLACKYSPSKGLIMVSDNGIWKEALQCE